MCTAAQCPVTRTGRLGSGQSRLSAGRTPVLETSMTQESKTRPYRQEHAPAPQAKDPDKPKEKSEATEMAGRHKNTGQKDHKGAR